jgi:hypothetical protein
MSEPAQPVTAVTPMDEGTKIRWELYGDHKKQEWEDIQKSTDSYDQSLLALSSGGLGLSIAFIKDIVPLHDAVWLYLLYSSWMLFIFTILCTVTSFLLSVEAHRVNLEFHWKFYIDRDNDYRDKDSWFSMAVRRCTLLAGLFFLGAIVCTAVFATKNISNYSKSSVPITTASAQVSPTIPAATPSPNVTSTPCAKPPVSVTKRRK